jgi:hypothetical protein
MPAQSRGADPSIRTEDYDPYLNPGCKLPIEVALEEDEIRGKLKALEKKYAKACSPARSTCKGTSACREARTLASWVRKSW